MEQKSITHYQIHRAHIQLKKSPELDFGRVLQESMLRILAVCLLFFFFFLEYCLSFLQIQLMYICNRIRKQYIKDSARQLL